jgi:hypothetical protein
MTYKSNSRGSFKRVVSDPRSARIASNLEHGVQRPSTDWRLQS